MQIVPTASPSIFNLQPNAVRPRSSLRGAGLQDRIRVDSYQEVNYRLPDPKYDQTLEHAAWITSALKAALSGTESVSDHLTEIV